MASVYGGRWEVIESMGAGGQGEVFSVRDLTSAIPDRCVLKRIRNGKRRDRFVREVQACKSLSHPGIIKVLDHSALDAQPSDAEKMFLVMPLMAQGDLEKRALVYKDSLDSTLAVGMALARALACAHGSGVIHRDVKPGNILFPGQGHDCVLSDFGICLIREDSRATETGEVVGPRAFMAPELEEGGKLEVTPSADVYSLAKVIYFMLSGGKILPRERHAEPAFNIHANKGVRHELLGKFFDRTLCPAERRIGTMAEVTSELQKIASWETKVVEAISPSASATLARLRSQQRDAASVADHNQAVAQLERAQLEAFQKRITQWLRDQVSKTVSEMTEPGIMKASHVSEKRWGEIRQQPRVISAFKRQPPTAPNPGQMIVEQGLEFSLQHSQGLPYQHCLLFRVFISHRLPRFGASGKKVDAQDTAITFLPYYFGSEHWQGYFTEGPRQRPAGGQLSAPGGMSSAFGDQTLTYQTTVGNWPSDTDAYARVINRGIEIFLTRVERWSKPQGGFSFE